MMRILLIIIIAFNFYYKIIFQIQYALNILFIFIIVFNFYFKIITF